MQKIETAQLPSQTLNVILAGQYCTISLYWRQERLYLDLTVDGEVICRGALCQDRADILQSESPYFKGTLHFVDTQGQRAPDWNTLDCRYVLLYRQADENLPDQLRY